MKELFSDVFHTQLWEEEAEPDNPFAAANCYCRGYDVYQDMMGQAGYFDYLFLLLQGEKPAPQAAKALELLAFALANPGPRDPSVHAAMCSGVIGSPAQASLMAAIAVGAGSCGGGREVFLAMQNWLANGMDLEKWQHCISNPAPASPPLIWPTIEHAPGFDPHGVRCAGPVQQTLTQLIRLLPKGRLEWLGQHQQTLESSAGIPFAMTGVAAAALCDLGFSASAGEMLFLMLRLPGAAAHALEQAEAGYKQFPFFALDLQNDPGPVKEQA